MSDSNWVFLEECEVLVITEKGIAVKYLDAQWWFPKSHVEDPDRLKEGDKNITLGISEWIANQKGIEV